MPRPLVTRSAKDIDDVRVLGVTTGTAARLPGGPCARAMDFHAYEDTARLGRLAHADGLEFWVAGSIGLAEVAPFIACKVDLICFGGAARHRTGVRTVIVHGQPDQTIKRPLVEKLVRAFERADPRGYVARRSHGRHVARTPERR